VTITTTSRIAAKMENGFDCSAMGHLLAQSLPENRGEGKGILVVEVISR
jgi:hypothetical protein